VSNETQSYASLGRNLLRFLTISLVGFDISKALMHASLDFVFHCRRPSFDPRNAFFNILTISRATHDGFAPFPHRPYDAACGLSESKRPVLVIDLPDDLRLYHSTIPLSVFKMVLYKSETLSCNTKEVYRSK